MYPVSYYTLANLPYFQKSILSTGSITGYLILEIRIFEGILFLTVCTAKMKKD